MTVINTNIKSLISQAAIDRNTRDLDKAMEQLSTGKRINSAADDAAGLAISNKMTAQIRGLNQAVRNANDGISMLQTAEGATQEITNMLQRMRELAVQAANGTYSSGDRSAMNLEYQQLHEEIGRIQENTQWNGTSLFTSAGYAASAVHFQVGMNGDSTSTISADLSILKSATDNVSANSNLLQLSAASNSLQSIDSAIAAVDGFRAEIGAKINRLTYAGDNLTNVSTNTQASRSRILDTDYAKAASELARTQIIQQAATSILAQANQSQQSVLQLLQGH
jgi:flagellin